MITSNNYSLLYRTENGNKIWKQELFIFGRINQAVINLTIIKHMTMNNCDR
jgi:hypothetical protein